MFVEWNDEQVKIAKNNYLTSETTNFDSYVSKLAKDVKQVHVFQNSIPKLEKG